MGGTFFAKIGGNKSILLLHFVNILSSLFYSSLFVYCIWVGKIITDMTSSSHSNWIWLYLASWCWKDSDRYNFLEKIVTGITPPPHRSCICCQNGALIYTVVAPGRYVAADMTSRFESSFTCSWLYLLYGVGNIVTDMTSPFHHSCIWLYLFLKYLGVGNIWFRHKCTKKLLAWPRNDRYLF